MFSVVEIMFATTCAIKKQRMFTTIKKQPTLLMIKKQLTLPVIQKWGWESNPASYILKLLNIHKCFCSNFLCLYLSFNKGLKVCWMDLDFQSLWVTRSKFGEHIKHKCDATEGELWNAYKTSFDLNRLHDRSNGNTSL